VSRNRPFLRHSSTHITQGNLVWCTKFRGYCREARKRICCIVLYNCDCLPAVASPTVRTSLTLLQSFLWGDIFLLSRRLALPLFFEAKAWREQVKPLQFFDMADHRSLVNAELARYGGIRRRAWSGCLIEVAFDRYIVAGAKFWRATTILVESQRVKTPMRVSWTSHS
jgi:hypothetical protein